MRATKIYVGNLPEKTDHGELRALFEKYGEVKECDIVRNYAFVHMTTEGEAKTAISALNNFEFLEQKISVELSHSKVRQRPGMGGKGQCYRCGRQGHWSKECPRNPAARKNNGPSSNIYPSDGYVERFPRYDRSYEAEYGSYGEQRSYVERMRPYPDPYDRRPMVSSQDNFMYYRRPYETYGYARRSPPLAPAARYDFTQDTTFTPDGIPSATRRAPGY